MEFIKNIIDYVALSIAPIGGLIISLLSYLNSRKNEKLNNKVERQITMKNKNGDNFYYEDNRKIEISQTISSLKASQQKLSIRQQNIDYLSNFLSKHSFIFLVFIYGINLWNYIYPLPNLPLINFNATQKSLLSFIATSLYCAIIPTIENILMLTALMCLVLIIKNLLSNLSFSSILRSIAYLIIALVYFICETVVANIDPTRIDFSFSQVQDFFSYLKNLIPYIVILSLIFLWTLSSALIKVLFETEHTKPNYRLFKVAFPRVIFFLLLFIFPVVIVFLAKYI